MRISQSLVTRMQSLTHVGRRLYTTAGVKAAGLPGLLTKEQILALPSTPAMSPSYPPGSYFFKNREYFIISYRTDPHALRRAVPQPLEPNADNIVLFEWIRMPDSTGFGSYEESGTVIPCTLNGQPVSYTAQMFLDDEPPVAAGREIWGFPKKHADPLCKVNKDTLTGTLDYNGVRVAVGTMAYKYQELPHDKVVQSLEATGCLLKMIPDVDWTPKIAQLVGYNLKVKKIHGAWTGPARLQLTPHVCAPAADLPILQVTGAKHIIADIELPYGRVLHDYVKEKEQAGGMAEIKLRAAHSHAAASHHHRTHMTRDDVLLTPSMPAMSPAFGRGPIQLSNRNYAVFKYQTDPTRLQPLVPDQFVVPADGTVFVQWVSTGGTGLGAYNKTELLIPVVHAATGKEYNLAAIAFLDCTSPITAGREVFGQPQKFAHPSMVVNHDTLVASLQYSGAPVATATMAYKSAPMPLAEAAAHLSKPQLCLKFIPDVNGSPAIAQLVEVSHTVEHVHGAWHSPARLELLPHVHAPLADLPVHHVLHGNQIQCDMTLHAGKVIHDYLQQ